MADLAAEAIAAALRDALARKDRARIVFAAAPSQAEVLAALVAAEGIDWSRVVAFHMDEYIGLPEGAPERFASWLDHHVFSRLPLAEVHPIRPDGDPDTVCAEYARLLDEAPIDVVCLGIGTNGHIAFNDPPVADFDDPLDVKVVELDPVCRQQQVDDKCFATLGDVPLRAITLTIPRLLRADRLVCAAPGRMKRAAVREALTGLITTDCPASILRTHPGCTIFLDRETDPDA
ncbi:glucosamine-6-phosphate deaminase [Rhodobacterales bacterium HKCCE2091]|nr:glucosamine-6-phosphate deaminase [Rhodobacterales bacterium HKCCE2091]